MNNVFITSDLSISALNADELYRNFPKIVQSGGYSCAINAEKLWHYGNGTLKAEVDNASLRVADGASIVIIAKLSADHKIEKIDFPDLVVRYAAEYSLDLGLLGASREVNSAAVKNLIERFSSLNVKGISGFEPEDAWLRFLSKHFEDNIGIVLLGLGSPKQEQLAARLSVRFPNIFFVCCGGAIDGFAGRNPRAPLFVQKSYFEWLYRLLQNPRKRFNRIHRLMPAASLIMVLWLRSLLSRIGSRYQKFEK